MSQCNASCCHVPKSACAAMEIASVREAAEMVMGYGVRDIFLLDRLSKYHLRSLNIAYHILESYLTKKRYRLYIPLPAVIVPPSFFTSIS